MQLEKEKAGERPSPGGDWLGVSRGRLKGVEGTLRHCSVLVAGREKGGYTGTSTFFSIGTGLGVMTPTTLIQCTLFQCTFNQRTLICTLDQ